MVSLDQVIDPVLQARLLAIEHQIAAWTRGFGQPSLEEWQRAENIALRAMLDLAMQEPQELLFPDGKTELLASLLARALGNSHRETGYETRYLATLSALAFASAGNFPSAAIFARESLRAGGVEAAERWMMQFLVDLRRPSSVASPPGSLVAYARLLDTALKTGFESDFSSASGEFFTFCRNNADELVSSDRYLLLIWTQVQQRLRDLSVARVLRESTFPHQGYADAVRSTTSPLLYPPQAQIAASASFARSRENILISLPTSTGKSLLGEMALVASLQWRPMERWLAVYLAPYRALTDQLFERMRRRLHQVGIVCVKRRGDYLTDMSPLQARHPTVLIATPEAFDALLRQSPDLYNALSACVFDEFHLIEQHQRGLRYEGLLARFRDGAAGEGWPKVIALSAVITDATSIRRWLKVDDTGFFQSDWKPTSRRVAIASPQGMLEYFTVGEEPRTNAPRKPAWQGGWNIRHPGIDRAPQKPASPVGYDYASYNAEIEQLNMNTRENIAAAALDQHARFREPILVLASSRADTLQIASQIADEVEPLEPAAPSNGLAREIRRRYPYLFTLQYCLSRGIAYHNASLPDWVRRRVEDLITARDLSFVVATTTLAEGVDMPFRVVVMADWQSWQFGMRRPMPSLLFQNIAGRCGRAWEFAEGDTILVDKPDRNSQVDFRGRYRQYLDLYVYPAQYPLRSSVDWSVASGDLSIVASTDAVLESQFAAYIAVCGQRDEPEVAFAHSLYAGISSTGFAHVRTATDSFTEAMLVDRHYPVFQRNSPLRLTEFGKAALKTGLSPRSGVSLARFLETYQPQQAPGKGRLIRQTYGVSWDPLLAAMWEKVKDGDWVQELEGDTLTRQVRRGGKPPTEANFPEILMAWVSGLPIEVIAFLILRKTEVKRDATRWLAKTAEEPGAAFEGWIEDLAPFCDNYLGAQWSWVCRGATVVAVHIGKEELASDLDRLAKRLRYGVFLAKNQEA